MLRIERDTLAACVPPNRYGDVLTVLDQAYDREGAPGGWAGHYQGGPIGYAQREFEIAPSQRDSRWYATPVADGQAVAWNPSLAGGAKAEDTYLVSPDGLERITESMSTRPGLAGRGRRAGTAASGGPGGGVMTLGSQETLGQATLGQAALGQETAARMTGIEALARRGIVMETAPQRSTARFPDGADFRIEIPSVEGPAVLRAVLEQAAAEGVTVNRVSQGSGAMLLSEHELAEMAALGADHGLEISLFVGPREEWDIGSLAQSDEGPSRGGLIRGSRQLRYAVDDVLRGVDCGIRGFLVADTGLLELLAGMQKDGEIPDSVVWKVSAMLAPGNPLSVAQLERLGADTVNVPSDMTLGLLAELRAATTLPIDLYVEAPSSMGGVVRGHEASELVAVASPMYVKFGLRNSRPLYPSGLHLAAEAAAIGREKVHRARVALEWMDRAGLELVQSGPGAPGLGVPEPAP